MTETAIQSEFFAKAECTAAVACDANLLGQTEFSDFVADITDQFANADPSQSLADFAKQVLRFWVADLSLGWPQANGQTANGKKIADDFFPDDSLYLSADKFVSVIGDVSSVSSDASLYSLVQFLCFSSEGYLKYFISAGYCQNQYGKNVSFVRDVRGLQKLIVILEMLTKLAEKQITAEAVRLQNVCSRLSGYLKMTLQGDDVQDRYWAEIELQPLPEGHFKPNLFYTDIYPVELQAAGGNELSLQLSPEQKRNFTLDQAWIVPIDVVTSVVRERLPSHVDERVILIDRYLHMDALPQIFADELCVAGTNKLSKRRAAKVVMRKLNDADASGLKALYLHVVLGEELGLVTFADKQSLRRILTSLPQGEFAATEVEAWARSVPVEERSHVFAFAGKMAESQQETWIENAVQTQGRPFSFFFNVDQPSMTIQWLRQILATDADQDHSATVSFADDHFDTEARYVAEKVWLDHKLSPAFPNAETSSAKEVAEFLNAGVAAGLINRAALATLHPVFSNEFYVRRVLKNMLDHVLTEQFSSDQQDAKSVITLEPVTCVLLDETLGRLLPLLGGSAQIDITRLREILFEPYNKNDWLQVVTHSRYNPNAIISTKAAPEILDEIFFTQLFTAKMAIDLPSSRVAAQGMMGDCLQVFSQQMDDAAIVKLSQAWTNTEVRQKMVIYFASEIMPKLAKLYRYEDPLQYEAMQHRCEIIQSCLQEERL